MDEIDFSSDSFADIAAKDSRYSPRAYALLADVLRFLCQDGRHASGEDILEEFKERALDQYGPMAFTVLSDWGVKRCEDIGEMMGNMVESRRIGMEESDSPEAFAGGYDFREAFIAPYEAADGSGEGEGG